MGLLRFVLAAIVVAVHNDFDVGISGHTAVLAFFTISGFVICMVLVEKYDRARDFYIARYMRLWPSYAVVLLIVLVFIIPPWDLEKSSPLVALYAAISTVSMAFQQTLWWIGVHADLPGFEWLTNAHGEHGFRPVAYGTRMPHMWSVGIELCFYSFAPMLARRPKALVGALLVAYAAHAAITLAFEPTHPLRYRSALNFAWLFLAGMASFHAYRKIQLGRMNVKPLIGQMGGALAGVGVLSLGAATNGGLWCDPFYAVFAALLGPIFHLTSNMRVDRSIGNLSYLVYVVHFPIVTYVLNAHKGDPTYTAFLVAVSTLAAIVLHLAVERPVEMLRRRFTGGEDQRSRSSSILATR